MSVGDILFSFKGRIPRRTYWLWGILSAAVIVALMMAVIVGFGAKAAAEATPPPPPAPTSALDSIKDTAPGAETPAVPTTTTPVLAEDAKMPQLSPIMLLLIGVLYIPLIWTGLAIQAKRWHDRGKSGWMCLISFLGPLAIWTFIECGCMRGTVGPNQYGQDPT